MDLVFVNLVYIVYADLVNGDLIYVDIVYVDLVCVDLQDALPLVDPRGCQGCTCPRGPNYFIFMQFLVKKF